MADNGYIALYRQYRPHTFDEVKGQDHIVNTLKNVIKTHKISHAYLFCGPRGTGKTSVAKIFASILNCQHAEKSENSPCQECLVNIDRNLDILEIDAASNTGVDDIRTLKENIDNLPSSSPYKIYIIDEVHMLSKNAWNALLKTIEEPPKHVIFILATTDPQKIPVTVLSRVQRFNFKRIDNEVIFQQLVNVYKHENIGFEDKALKLIAILANGAMRDALSMADQVSIFAGENEVKVEDVEKMFGLTSTQNIINLLNLIAAKNINEVLELVTSYIENGADIERMLLAMVEAVKDFVVWNKTNKAKFLKSLSVEQIQQLKLNIASAYVILNQLVDALKDIKYSDTVQQTFELALLKICTSDFASPSGENVESPEVLMEQKITNLQNSFLEKEKNIVDEQYSNLERKTIDSIVDEAQIKPQTNSVVEDYFEQNESQKQEKQTIQIDNVFINPSIDKFNIKESYEQELKEQNNDFFDLKNEETLDNEDLLQEIEADEQTAITTTHVPEPIVNQATLNPVQKLTESLNELSDLDGGEYSQQHAKKHEKNYDRLNQMLSYDDISNDSFYPRSNSSVEDVLQKTQEFAVEQNQVTAEYSVIEEDILTNNKTEENYAIATKDIFGLDDVIENQSTDLTMDELINLMMLSAMYKSKTNNPRATKTIYDSKIAQAKDLNKYDEFTPFINILENFKIVISTDQFIIFQSNYQSVVDKFNQLKKQDDYWRFVQSVFGKSLHLFAATGQLLERAKNFYKSNFELIRSRQVRPLPPLPTLKKDDSYEKLQDIFGDALKTDWS
ncbi:MULTISPECIES: DNA polymerase III subunit gamma/tau [unclassified Mycoplasma]